MIVCVCSNVSDSTINQELQKGSTTKDIIKQYKCTKCKICIPYITKIAKEYVANNVKL